MRDAGAAGGGAAPAGGVRHGGVLKTLIVHVYVWPAVLHAALRALCAVWAPGCAQKVSRYSPALPRLPLYSSVLSAFVCYSVIPVIIKWYWTRLQCIYVRREIKH